MQVVTQQFTDTVNAPAKKPQLGFLVSWRKNINPDVAYFKLDHSTLDGGNILRGTGDTITFFDKYDYMDETQFVTDFKVTRKFSNQPWGVVMATAEITLDNTSKRFYPDVDPDIGDYVDMPDRPIKLKVGYNGEFVDYLVGYSDRPVSNLVKRETKITAFDAMTYLSGVKSDLPAFVDTSMQDIVEAILQEQGFGVDQYNIEASLQRHLGYVRVKDRPVTDILQEMAEAEGLLIFVDEHGIIQVWNRLHLIGDRAPVWTFTYSNLANIQNETTSIVNSAQVIAKPYKPAAWNKMWELDDASDETLIPPNGTKDIFADFEDDLGPYYAISVDTPVPEAQAAGSSGYATNTGIDGDGSSNAAAISLTSVYNFGDKYRMTFRNTSDRPTYVTRLQLFGQPAKVTAVKSNVQEDKESIEKYGLNPDNQRETYELENSYIQNTAMANSMAWMLVDTSKNPRTRMKLDNFVVPHLQLGDPIEVEIRDTNESKYCVIAGVELQFKYPADITQVIFAEEIEYKQYFRLDHSHLDGIFHLAL